MASRKALTDAYKAFRKLPEEEKGAAVGPLLKAFQEEVDALTRRSRLAEKSFLQFMAAMLEAPNPAPFLLAGLDASRSAARLADELARSQAETRAASATAAAALEEAATERERLRADVADLERELAKLSNQDITLREMETRLVDFEGTMEAQIAARLGEREAELRKVFEGELEAVREAETAAEARVAALQVRGRGGVSEGAALRRPPPPSPTPRAPSPRPCPCATRRRRPCTRAGRAATTTRLRGRPRSTCLRARPSASSARSPRSAHSSTGSARPLRRLLRAAGAATTTRSRLCGRRWPRTAAPPRPRRSRRRASAAPWRDYRTSAGAGLRCSTRSERRRSGRLQRRRRAPRSCGARPPPRRRSWRSGRRGRTSR